MFSAKARNPLDDRTLNFTFDPGRKLVIPFCSDGWTKNDLVYSWYDVRPVQIPGNLSLPGGFKLGGFGNQYCDVITTTGTVQYSTVQYGTVQVLWT